ncbi:MAG: DMT family transporter, partial [Pseudomonadota bacterium]
MTPFRFLVLVGITMTWGLHFSVIKSTVGDIPPIFYVTLRMALVAILLSPLLRWYPGQMRNIMLAGLFYGGINYVFMFSGLNFITESLGSILMQTYVPFAMLFSVLFLGEVIQWRRILGLILAFSGIFIIISAGGDLTGSDNLILGATLVV